MFSKLQYINICISWSAAKLLFLPCYFSTDFDVHRNWLAITFNLPTEKWYFDTTSEWTLDYPPLFALFEYLLSLMAHMYDPDIVKLTREPIRTYSAVVFQRTSVILSDTLYYFAIYKLCQAAEKAGYWNEKNENRSERILTRSKSSIKHTATNSDNNQENSIEDIFKPRPSLLCAILLLFQPGFILIDHIHFQYNAFLSAYLLMSIACMINKQYVNASLWFSLLINLKHIYLYCVPAYVLYLLFNYCLRVPKNDLLKSIRNLVKLALVVITVFFITYMPYARIDQMSQILNRLFPFKRGLSHSYWAPNIWSIYNFIDKIISVVVCSRCDHKPDMTKGLVGEFEHAYLPNIRPWMTFCLVILFNLPLIPKLWSYRGKDRSSLFLRAVAIASFTSFQFGWHVHEKAILLVLLPLIPLAFTNSELASILIGITLVSTYSLFPLFFLPGEWLIKVFLLVMYQQYITRTLTLYHDTNKKHNTKVAHVHTLDSKKLNKYRKLYLFGIIIIELYVTFIHGSQYFSITKAISKYEFLPLMLVSVYSAIGLTFSYIHIYYEFIFCCPEEL